MAEEVELLERPEAGEMYMIVGWRQWADAGSISSGLPRYLIQQSGARQIGHLSSDGFYLFQIPGTHDLVRPVVLFEQGLLQSLEGRRNELFYTESNGCGLVIFLGDEPHLDVERYTTALLDAAQELGVKRIVSLGGVYGEVPYDKERTVSSMYSLEGLKEEVEKLAVTFSDYHGGASIGSYLCSQAQEREIELVGLYGFVPTYDFSEDALMGNSIRLENDFMAWLGIMRRINYMLKLDFDLTDLEERSKRLIEVVNEKVDEMESASPELGLRQYLTELSESFPETIFDPLDEGLEEELRRLLDDFDPEDL